MRPNKRVVGSYYEQAAVSHLERLDFHCIEKNVWTEHGEIDLVLTKENTVYFVEVKFRSSDAYGTPRQAITFKKKTNMKKTALQYLKANPGMYASFAISFLGITVDQGQLVFDFIENIFE